MRIDVIQFMVRSSLVLITRAYEHISLKLPLFLKKVIIVITNQTIIYQHMLAIFYRIIKLNGLITRVE